MFRGLGGESTSEGRSKGLKGGGFGAPLSVLKKNCARRPHKAKKDRRQGERGRQRRLVNGVC